MVILEYSRSQGVQSKSAPSDRGFNQKHRPLFGQDAGIFHKTSHAPISFREFHSQVFFKNLDKKEAQ